MIRIAEVRDLDAIRAIYNEGIADRIATLDTDAKDDAAIREWFAQHDGRYAVLVAERERQIAGWASLNRYSHRCAYAGVAEISVYVRRDSRGTGLGTSLLLELERIAVLNRFHKLVLFALDSNRAGRGLYTKSGFREVGIFKEQGQLDGGFVDVVIMEKLLAPAPRE
ncbi:MAG: arsinothricin resistance N-acetyltransferase ArsN1 family A [Vulcanimicrobiaceae bacterium]